MRNTNITKSRDLRLAAIMVNVLTLTVISAGCSGGANGDDSTSARRIPISTIDYGIRRADLGDPRELNRLANLYATLQKRFQAGDMAHVCDRVSPHLIEQFPRGSDLSNASCEKRLVIYARRIKKSRGPAPRLKIDWLRIYDILSIGGITATDNRGRILRVPFHRENGIWKLRLGVFARPDTLNGTLTR